MKNDYLFLPQKQINQINKLWWWLTKNQRYYTFLWFLAGLMLVVGDTKLVIATGLATMVMSTIYSGNNLNWQELLQEFSQSLTGVNRQLALAVGSGAVVAIASYLCLAIWAEIDNHWLATALITQGLVSTTALGIFVWYLLKKQSLISANTSTNNFHDLVNNLTINSKIKRLLTINQLMDLWINQRLTAEETRHLQNYLYLLQQSETDKVIQEKIVESLSKLSLAQEINTNQPLTIPSPKQKQKRLSSQVKQRKIQQIRA